MLETPALRPAASVTFLELEITRDCQLTCGSHCYAQAGPGLGHGTMTAEDWKQVMDDAAQYGVTKVQLIGGEPTRHPAFAELLQYALNCGLKVEVFSNLYRIKPEWWELFSDSRVSLAASYYSDEAAEHDQITGRPGSHAKTRANIAEAVRRGIPLRVGIIHMRDGQRSDQARAEMAALGVTRVRVDHVRGIGNGAAGVPCVTELCGNCGRGVTAVGPDGDVWPCVMARFLHPAGNVKASPLADILGGEVMAALVSAIPSRRRGGCSPEGPCGPDNDSCGPAARHDARGGCTPDEDSCQPSPGTGPATAGLTEAHACAPDSCTPREDSCQPSPGAGPTGPSY
jgi:MoaA/NifB/PqqE/SkfB family radical SAM enzyme